VLSKQSIKENSPKMKKIMTAALSLSLLSGTAVLFAQNTSTDTATKSAKKHSHHKKAKKSTATDTMSAPK
jgi:uncharacterized protein YxeA